MPIACDRPAQLDALDSTGCAWRNVYVKDFTSTIDAAIAAELLDRRDRTAAGELLDRADIDRPSRRSLASLANVAPAYAGVDRDRCAVCAAHRARQCRAARCAAKPVPCELLRLPLPSPYQGARVDDMLDKV